MHLQETSRNAQHAAGLKWNCGSKGFAETIESLIPHHGNLQRQETLRTVQKNASTPNKQDRPATRSSHKGIADREKAAPEAEEIKFEYSRSGPQEKTRKLSAFPRHRDSTMSETRHREKPTEKSVGKNRQAKTRHEADNGDRIGALKH
ncbi:hypothetical protein MPTK1_2g22740 [Marchantia polymorpha subsp. ruderalis]|uniref:Uncharacterized protein n=1 Tax=Marchantia polymorpha TaxID=3197 RepID=A0A2R6WN82_MARPO|nr:hypothetical protein MARPO_0072s0057 [Marchantia polymorpha]BBN03337.1 hypothetical protein Mp_2g22740 [Marchantia polymorpha subsp. ruderalis]|eukprot:PTQ35314.1 hypothetical protein MARPO_0072s0057 [Marchantia polymorpha]